MPEIRDEAKLVQRAKAFDQKAISQLYQDHVQSIYKYVLLRVNDVELAKDITSDVFLRALEGLQTFEYRDIPFLAWLFRIARARIVDHYRRCSRRQSTLTLNEGFSSTGDDPYEAAAKNLEQQELLAAIERLTEEQRLVILLRFMEHDSLAEVARKLGKTEGAVKSLQHRALAALNRIMEGKDL